MTDLPDDDDLFAVRPAPRKARARPAAPPPPKPSGPVFRKNPGRLPDECKGKRILAKMRHGGIGRYDEGPMSPKGWPADGQGGCRWKLIGDETDIVEYAIL